MRRGMRTSVSSLLIDLPYRLASSHLFVQQTRAVDAAPGADADESAHGTNPPATARGSPELHERVVGQADQGVHADRASSARRREARRKLTACR